jgi:hypothetical protein
MKNRDPLTRNDVIDRKNSTSATSSLASNRGQRQVRGDRDRDRRLRNRRRGRPFPSRALWACNPVGTGRSSHRPDAPVRDLYLYNCGIPFARGSRTGLAHCHFGRLIVRAGLFFEKLVVCIERNCRGRGRKGTFVPLERYRDAAATGRRPLAAVPRRGGCESLVVQPSSGLARGTHTRAYPPARNFGTYGKTPRHHRRRNLILYI